MAFLFDQYKEDVDTIFNKMIYICQDKLNYNSEVEDYILELINRISEKEIISVR